MIKYITLLIIFLWPLLIHAQDKPLVLTSVTVIDMVHDNLQPNMTVVITNNKITAISKKAKAPQNATIIDAKGKFLIPGLWDMHVHIRETENISFPLFIANGVTGIREMHYPGKCSTIGKWKDSVSTIVAPRIGAAAGCIVDGPGDNRGWGFTVVDNEEGARQEVRNLKQSGADFIKVYTRLPLSIYQAIADEAKKQNMSFAGHIPFGISATTCSKLGQKSFEHMDLFHSSFSREETAILQSFADSLTKSSISLYIQMMHKAYESYDPQKVVALAKVMKKNGTWVCPTIALSQTVRNRYYLSKEGSKRLDHIPSTINQTWKPKSIAPRAEKDSLFFVQLFEREKQILKLLHQEGVKMIAGTDTSPVRYLVPGYSLHEELALYVQAGLTPYEALKTATLHPALFLKRTHELGTVETGKLADLLLLEANPLENIDNTKRIVAVVVNGRYFSKEDLGKMLSEAEAAASRK